MSVQDSWWSRLRSCFEFFFSSRRRHTRCLSDWSSDVCSSDLDQVVHEPQTEASGMLVGAAHPRLPEYRSRSEERRVGKECRYQWSPYKYKKKQQYKIE